ncbi:hypothetical protein M413DRAFT_240326 [Hebeloma cylindrosporum]|uniref:Uncharacterized protein n=1 Tax=Hebeloma cylindrosporum TaxID=76867 RepID=A0A0C2XLS7_HEBCY|nr:hypothetical protein M413DRAFT_240326 [Hebeloma cylindrosporum h7]
MHFLLLQFLIVLGIVASGLFLILIISLCSRKLRNTTSRFHAPLGSPVMISMSNQQRGDASDVVAPRANITFSVDGRGDLESLVIPPPAVNKSGSNVERHDQRSSTLPIHMDGAER